MVNVPPTVTGGRGLPPEVAEVLDTIRRRTRWLVGSLAALFVVFVILVLTLTLALSNASAVASERNSISFLQENIRLLKLDFDTVQAAQKTQSQNSQAFVRSFIAEQNYICEVTILRAAASGLPPPPEGVCNVKLPGS